MNLVRSAIGVAGHRTAVILWVILTASCTSSPRPTPLPNDPPKITCPLAQTVTASSVPMTVPYPPVSVTGGAVPESTVCAPPTGSNFPAGSTSVSCTVTDAQLRTDSCSFTVTVTVLTPRLTATRFVAFGDSITEGKPGTSSYHPGISIFHTAYAEVLYNLLTARYSAQTIELFDEGIGGERAQPTGMLRLPGVLRADAPQALLLQDGANDVNGDGMDAIPNVISALRAMVQEARRQGVVVFLGTLLPERPGGKRALHPEVIVPINVQIRALAASEGAILVDLYEAFGGSPDPWLDPDGLHPNAAGYQKMAETFFAAIQRRFEVLQVMGAEGRQHPDGTR